MRIYPGALEIPVFRPGTNPVSGVITTEEILSGMGFRD
jgi:hypothetical protein